MRRLAALTLAFPLVAAAPDAPRPGKLHTFKDWAVGCDNTRRCTMASLQPETAEGPGYTMELTRAPGASGAFEVALGIVEEGGKPPAALTIDGKRFTVAGSGLSGASAAAIAQAVANGRVLTLQAATGRRLGTISLAGASAALRHIDAEQGRVGTTSAAVAKGPATTPAPSVAPPSIRAVPIGASVRIAPALVAAMRKRAQCEPIPQGVDLSPDLRWLGAGKAVAIVPCTLGAYNVVAALFVVEGNRATPAITDAPSGIDGTDAPGVPTVVNAAVENGILTSYAKGRGLGDCGIAQRFAWDGARLRLVEQSEMEECRGNTNLIRTWTARVVRP